MSEWERGRILYVSTGIPSHSEESCLHPWEGFLSFLPLTSASTQPNIIGTKAKTGDCRHLSCVHTMPLLWGLGPWLLSCPATHSQSHVWLSVLAQLWLQPKAQKTTRHRTVRGLEMTLDLQESVTVSKKIKYFACCCLVCTCCVQF